MLRDVIHAPFVARTAPQAAGPYVPVVRLADLGYQADLCPLRGAPLASLACFLRATALRRGCHTAERCKPVLLPVILI